MKSNGKRPSPDRWDLAEDPTTELSRHIASKGNHGEASLADHGAIQESIVRSLQEADRKEKPSKTRSPLGRAIAQAKAQTNALDSFRWQCRCSPGEIGYPNPTRKPIWKCINNSTREEMAHLSTGYFQDRTVSRPIDNRESRLRTRNISRLVPSQRL